MRSARQSACVRAAARTTAALACAPLALAAFAFVGCFGKIAPVPSDGGDAGYDDAAFTDADQGDAEADPVVDAVDPRVGPNSGGTFVTITGSGFAESTKIFFAGFPADQVHCVNTHRCTAVSPFAGYSATDQLVHVEATNGGTIGGPGTRTSAERPQDLFRFTAGPDCPQSLLCVGADPLFQMTCPQSVNFYFLARTDHQAFLATAKTYAFQTQSIRLSGAICYGDPMSSSCTWVDLYEPKWSICGELGYCDECKRCGGVCTTLASGDPICSKWKWPPPGGCP